MKRLYIMDENDNDAALPKMVNELGTADCGEAAADHT
jgi:hypothetical protein